MEPGEAYTRVRDLLEKTFSDESGLTRLGGSPHGLDVGRWWLEDTDEVLTPLSDRVERAVVNFLTEHPGKSLAEMDAALCAAFPGLLTPAQELVGACLDSYGERHPVDNGWYLRIQDRPYRRMADADEVRGLLIELGERLGYSMDTRADVVWSSPAGEVARFGIQLSAGVGKMTGEPSFTPLAFLVIPGGRANLLMYKIRHDPRLVGTGWLFLKFRHVRALAESAEVTRENWQERLGLDPLTVELAQMRLL